MMTVEATVGHDCRPMALPITLCGSLSRLASPTTIANRGGKKADRLAAEVGARAVPFDEVCRAGKYDIVVNATSLGQSDVGGASPIPEDAVRAGQLIMDIVYKPLQTRFVEAARRRGAIVLDGGRMLLHQAAAQVELYTGHAAPLDAMDAALHRAIASI